jgi:hypothetical protein
MRLLLVGRALLFLAFSLELLDKHLLPTLLFTSMMNKRR